MKKIIIAMMLLWGAVTVSATEIASAAPGDTTYVSDIYVMPSSEKFGPEVDFLLMMRCVDGVNQPEYLFGYVMFAEDTGLYKQDAFGNEIVLGKGTDVLPRFPQGRLLIKLPDGTIWDNNRTLLTDNTKAYKVYPSSTSSDYKWVYMNVAEYYLTPAQVARMAKEGISRLRLSTINDQYMTSDIDAVKAQSLIDIALKQVHALKDGTEKPRGTFIHKDIPKLENPFYKDF